ncbi:MAG: hypothetical protein JNL77_02675 [Nitrosomonas sp.]|nr:hypothetical protein [Nitrosomonas sp.]
MNNLTATKTASDNLSQLGKSLSQKLGVALTEQSTVKQRLGQATANLAAVEKRHILDEATDTELLEARKVVTDLTVQVEAIDRRIELIREAIAENDQKIAAAAQAFRNARVSFCFASRDTALAKIKQNQQFKEILLEAMAANSSNGLVMHSYHAKTFTEQFISQILPEISEDEARAATERFTEENDLEV